MLTQSDIRKKLWQLPLYDRGNFTYRIIDEIALRISQHRQSPDDFYVIKYLCCPQEQVYTDFDYKLFSAFPVDYYPKLKRPSFPILGRAEDTIRMLNKGISYSIVDESESVTIFWSPTMFKFAINNIATVIPSPDYTSLAIMSKTQYIPSQIATLNNDSLTGVKLIAAELRIRCATSLKNKSRTTLRAENRALEEYLSTDANNRPGMKYTYQTSNQVVMDPSDGVRLVYNTDQRNNNDAFSIPYISTTVNSGSGDLGWVIQIEGLENGATVDIQEYRYCETEEADQQTRRNVRHISTYKGNILTIPERPCLTEDNRLLLKQLIQKYKTSYMIPNLNASKLTVKTSNDSFTDSELLLVVKLLGVNSLRLLKRRDLLEIIKYMYYTF